MSTRMWWRLPFLSILSLGLAGSLWAAALSICPKCGSEATSGESACGHCGAVLPVVSRVAASNQPAVVQEKLVGEVSVLALEAARMDKRLADQNLAKRPELAYAYCENALAVSRLIRREETTDQTGKALVDALERCRQRLALASRPCTGCNGSGRRTVQFQMLGGGKSTAGAASTKGVDGPVCEECNGKGSVSAGRSADELRVLLAQGRRDFETRQQAAGRVASRRVWVPAELLALLDVRAQALLRTACPTPCSRCMGIGVQDCSRCRGAGRVKCTHNGCVDGWVVRKESNALLSKGAISRKERCPDCQGSSLALCADCRGGGTNPCRTCNGTGRNAACEACGGQGWSTCAKCQGNGVLNGLACPACRARNEILCPKCHGEGCSGK